MRIAFVGKGGSGKTTLAVLFAQYLKEQGKRVVLVDADLNMHTASLLGFESDIPQEKHISNPDSIKEIQNFLKKDNGRIKDLRHFRKTTPPTNESQLITLSDNNLILQKYSSQIDGINLMVVGTYQEDGIGTACYHNNLSIFENILTHLRDSKDEVLVADMVAGVDSFANTLHSQFDLIVLVIEPTLRSVEVFKQFMELAKDAGVESIIYAIGNKTKSQKDKDFIATQILKNKLLGFLNESNYLHRKDQEGGKIDIKKLEKENLKVLESISKKLFSIEPDAKKRYERLLELHKVYVAQASIKDRFGDLTDQIDLNFHP